MCCLWDVLTTCIRWGFPGKECTCQCRRCGFDPWVRKLPWRRNGNLLHHSCLENSMGTGVWQAILHGVAGKLNTTQHLNSSSSISYGIKVSKCIDPMKIWMKWGTDQVKILFLKNGISQSLCNLPQLGFLGAIS